MYNRRAGTSGISGGGALYKVKLISLLYFRASHDYTIEDFKLASNLDNVGLFNDVCFRVKVKVFHKPVAVFIQARHTERMMLPLNNLKELFCSYLKIIPQFDPRNNDLFLNGKFDEVECVFVIYTNATVDGTVTCDDSVAMPFPAKLYDLIGTGGTVKQLYNQEEHVKSLCEVAMKEQMVYLAKRMARFITDGGNFEMLLFDDTTMRFHVILGREVFNVSGIQPAGHRVAAFRSDFFDTNDEYLTIFKDTLYKEIIQKRKIDPTQLKSLLSQLFADPEQMNDARNLSKVIGTAVTYNNGVLKFNKKYTEYYTPQLDQVNVSELTVNRAIELAAREILSSLQFKVPATFGSKDLIIRGNDVKKERRINYLASKIRHITQMSDSYEPTKIVTIDESLENGFLQHNGGITGAIGNLFVLDDDNPKLMKITHNSEQLGRVATRLYFQLYDQIHNLHEYRFCFKLNRCPKLSFECNYHEQNLAKDFLNRLLFYSNQADEYRVEGILKNEIEYYLSDQAEFFHVNANAIFSRHFDFIQKWWSQRHVAYVTRN